MAKFNFDSLFQNNRNENKKNIKQRPSKVIENVGEFKFDSDSEWFYGPMIKLNLPKNQIVQVVLVIPEEDIDKKTEIFESVDYLTKNSVSIFEASEKYIYDYYINTKKLYGDQLDFPIIKNQKDIWDNIIIGRDAMINLRTDDDKIYISLECECKWEREHGLQIVIKEGKKINKIGQYDGHLTNSDAYAKNELENIVYYS